MDSYPKNKAGFAILTNDDAGGQHAYPMPRIFLRGGKKPMADTLRGQLWPLQVFLLVTLTGAVIALVMRFGDAHPGYDDIAFTLLSLSLIAAVVLYAPRYWVFKTVPVPDIEASLTEITDAIGELQTRVDAIATQLNAGGTRLDTIATNLDATGVVRTQLAAIAAQLNVGGEVRTRVDAIAANLDAANVVRTQLTAIVTQLNADGDVQTKLDAIAARLSATGDVGAKLDAIEKQTSKIAPPP